MDSNQNTTQKRVKYQKVKNYDAENINEQNVKSKHVDMDKSGSGVKKTKSEPKSFSNGGYSKKATVWTKILIGLTYIFGLTSLLYFLSSAWIFLGTISLGFSLTIFLLAKQPVTREASGKVFFVSLCGTIVSILFWVLYLTTRRYGIGFLSSLFRGIQIAGAVISAMLILYFFVEFVSGGMLKINWIENITDKTEQKLSHKGAKN